MYIITTICFGNKYIPLREHWEKNIKETCKRGTEIIIWDDTNIKQQDIKVSKNVYAFWDSIRLKKNIDLLLNRNIPVIHCDMDIIIRGEINEIVELPYDFIISTEIGGNKSFPSECSNKLGFGVCSGFYILKKNSLHFIIKIFKNMIENKYNSYSDQVTLMNYITSSEHKIYEVNEKINGTIFKNRIIEIDEIKICVLDFELIERDPFLTKNQLGLHINIDNVGGVDNFIKYFYEKLENLPLTCRCGKTHLGDNNICNHIELRKK
jgi:hypothetical protein